MEAIQPAHLSFLSIYNPALGQSDETLHEQVVYYYASKSSKTRPVSSASIEQQQREEKNERLRQIGLAQGMVEFARYASKSLSSIVCLEAETAFNKGLSPMGNR
jgi:hypothetical protein